MRLWNDYEGTTIADAYPIEKLIRPEGRSAFFSTKNGTGTPAVIRLIESINDEGEILNRWKTVAALHANHLITLKKFGQTVFEGTPLIYVLMESNDADLSGILQQRTLNAEETREIAISLIDAVGALHASGIVHEHIEPAHVLATGELVKLRSDCVREAPEGEEGIALMKRDVHDIAVVLLQALTNRRSLDAIGATRLPAPFDGMIRNGINGTWGLAQMASALNPPMAKVVAAAPVASASAAVPVAPVVSASAGASSLAAPVSGGAEASARAEQLPLAMPEAAPVASAPRVPAKDVSERLPGRRVTVPIEDDRTLLHRRRWIVGATAGVVILATLGWHEMHKPVRETAAPITTLSDAGPGASSAPAPTPAPVQPVAPVATQSTASPASASVQQPAQAGVDVPRWRVVAFTYNHQDQAQHKVQQLAEKDAALRPEVFSPNGDAPYLVTVGGAMTRADATAFRDKAAAEGLPEDIYIQNYEGRARHVRR